MPFQSVSWSLRTLAAGSWTGRTVAMAYNVTSIVVCSCYPRVVGLFIASGLGCK